MNNEEKSERRKLGMRLLRRAKERRDRLFGAQLEAEREGAPAENIWLAEQAVKEHDKFIKRLTDDLAKLNE